MATQHGWWDDKGVFHPTKTLEEATYQWRQANGYNPSGVFDTPGGGSIDTRNVKPSAQQSGGGIANVPAPPAPSGGIQHGWWDANHVFHPTKTLEDAVYAWRANSGYNPSGVFDMPGGLTVDTRKVTPEIAVDQGTNVPQVTGLNTPEVGSNLPSGYRVPAPGYPYNNMLRKEAMLNPQTPTIDTGYNSLRRKLSMLGDQYPAQPALSPEKAAVAARPYPPAAQIGAVHRWANMTRNNILRTAELFAKAEAGVEEVTPELMQSWWDNTLNNLAKTSQELDNAWTWLFGKNIIPPSNAEIDATRRRQIEANAQVDQQIAMSLSEGLQAQTGGGLTWSLTLPAVITNLVQQMTGVNVTGRPAGEAGDGTRTGTEAQVAADVTGLSLLGAAYDPKMAAFAARADFKFWAQAYDGLYSATADSQYGIYPDTVSFDAINQINVKPTDPGLQAYFMQTWGVTGFDSVDEFMTTIGYYKNDVARQYVRRNSTMPIDAPGGGTNYVYNGTAYTPYTYPRYSYGSGSNGNGYGMPYMSVLWRISA